MCCRELSFDFSFIMNQELAHFQSIVQRLSNTHATMYERFGNSWPQDKYLQIQQVLNDEYIRAILSLLERVDGLQRIVSSLVSVVKAPGASASTSASPSRTYITHATQTDFEKGDKRCAAAKDSGYVSSSTTTTKRRRRKRAKKSPSPPTTSDFGSKMASVRKVSVGSSVSSNISTTDSSSNSTPLSPSKWQFRGISFSYPPTSALPRFLPLRNGQYCFRCGKDNHMRSHCDAVAWNAMTDQPYPEKHQLNVHRIAAQVRHYHKSRLGGSISSCSSSEDLTQFDNLTGSIETQSFASADLTSSDSNVSVAQTSSNESTVSSPLYYDTQQSNCQAGGPNISALLAKYCSAPLQTPMVKT